MEDSNQSLLKSFGKLSLKKRVSNIIARLTEPSQEPETNNTEAEGSESRILSTQNSISSQLSQSEDSKEDHRVLAPTTTFVQRKRKIDGEIHKELKAVRKSLDQQNTGETVPIPVYLKVQRRYTEDTKAKVVELAGKIGPHQVSVQTGIPEASIRRWKKVNGTKSVGSGRQPQHPEIEAELIKMFCDSRSHGILTTNASLLHLSRKIAERLKKSDFVGTMSWLDGVKKRHNICYRKSTRTGQKIPADAQNLINCFKEKIIGLFELHKYPPGSVVNIDETGIFFDTVSNYTLEFKVSLIFMYY